MDDGPHTGQSDADADGAARTTSRAAALGPVAAGLLLDLVDAATFGPIGLWTGLLAGGAAGYLLAMAMGVRRERRFGYALAAGAYCTLPFTAFLPVATALGALIRWREKDLPGADAPTRRVRPPTSPEAPRVIEAEYESRWDRD